MNPDKAIKAIGRASGTLLGALRGLGPLDEIVRRPSLLPGWTVGHVLTHLARNANSYERMIRAAGRGRAVDQYPGGIAQRQEEIEAGSARPAAVLLEDLVAAESALIDAFSELTGANWRARTRRWGNQAWPVSDIPFLRLREVSIHSIDLGLNDLTSDAWTDDYVEAELRRQLVALPARLPGRVVLEVCPADRDWDLTLVGPGDLPGPVTTIDGTARQILAWLVGRATPPAAWPSLSAWKGIP